MKTFNQIYEAIINDSRIDFPHEGLTSTVWDNVLKKIVLSDMYKIDWCGDISDLEGAISYLNIMKSTVDTV